jgi:DNA gyrase subunit A
MVSEKGKAIVFKESEVRETGRSSIGVRGMEIDTNDEIASVDVFNNQEFNKNLIVIGDKGIGKKNSAITVQRPASRRQRCQDCIRRRKNG